MSHDTLDLSLHGRIKCRVGGGTGVSRVKWGEGWVLERKTGSATSFESGTLSAYCG